MGEHASQAHWMADSSPGLAESEWRYLCSCWVQVTPEPSHLGASNQHRFLAYKVETGPREWDDHRKEVPPKRSPAFP